jgi:DNA-3-methyladenine glycosylase I
MPRCPWATKEPNITYHDKEWGVLVHDDRVLFEFLILEGAQAGLSWTTILSKRENYRKAFDGFRPEKIARYGKRDVQRLLRDEGIVRNRLKIAATIENAKAFLTVQKEFGTFDAYLWSFVGGKPIQNRWRRMSDRADAHGRIGRHEPRSAATRIQICRLDDLLRVLASRRHGQRSPRHMPATQRARSRRRNRKMSWRPLTSRNNSNRRAFALHAKT